MYSVSNAYLTAMQTPIQEHRLTGTIGSLSFDESNVVDGSFTITNQSTDTSDVVLGSCYVGELTAEFTGININWSDWVGKVITPVFGLKIGSGVNDWEDVPLGVFKVSKATHTAFGVQVTAYDNMTKFDKKFIKSHFKNLKGLYPIISRICTDCNVMLGMTQAQIEALPNGNSNKIFIYGADGKPAEFANDITTNRDLLFWCAQAMGCFATINRAGQLEFRQYTQTVVDKVDETHRLVGATFADYITHYIGVYVENLDSQTFDYYGYDATALQQELNETAAEISADNDSIDELVDELAEWDRKLENHECTQEEYDAAVAEITAELHPLEIEVKQLTKRVAWLESALQQAGDDGADMDLGANPLLMDKNLTRRDTQRRNVLGALANISYTPFSASVVCGCIYDLGDVIQFSGGLYNSTIDSFGCVMSYVYTHNGGTELEGFGVDPAIVQIRTKEQKSTDRAEANAIKAKEPVHLEKMDDGSVVVRDDSILRDDAAGGESDRVWSFMAWAKNDVVASPAEVWTKLKVEIKIDHNAIICDYPVEVSGQYRTADIGGKTYTDSQVAFVVKVPKDGDKPKICEKNTFVEGNNPSESEKVYTAWDRRVQPNYGVWGDWVEITYKAASVGDWDYYVAIRLVGTTYAGLYGMSYPDKHYPSAALFQADLEAGKIDPPQLLNGDVVLPTDTTKKSLQGGLQELANYIGNNSGDAYDTSTQLSEISPIDVESDLSEQGIVRTISQIKDGVGGFYTNIQSVGRGNPIAYIHSKNGQDTVTLYASTNITEVKESIPTSGGEEGDTRFILKNDDGFDVSMSSHSHYIEFDPVIEFTGYHFIARGDAAGSDPEYGGYAAYKVDGLTVGKEYTFTYTVDAYMHSAAGIRQYAEYYSPDRYGFFGLLYSDTDEPDTTDLPANDTSNTWYPALGWQNFANLTTAASYTNAVTATASTMYLILMLEPLKRYHGQYTYIDIASFKSADTSFEMTDLYVRGADHWFKYAGGGGGGTSDYNSLTNKPSINSVTLLGDKTTRDLGMIEECTQAEYDQKSSTEKNNPDKVFYIKDGGGGGGGGGGGSYTETELFSGNASTAGNIALSDVIGNYDEFVIWAGWSASNVNGVIPIRVSVAMFKTFTYVASPQTSTDHIFCYLYSTQYFRVARGSDDTKIYLFDNHSGAIKRVVGIKY